MPGRKPPESAEDIALRQIDEEDTAALERIAREMGPPPDSQRLSEREEVELWGQRDPSVDYLDLATRLLAEGIPPEEAARFLVLEEIPELVPLFAQPTQSFETADMLARLAEYPYRAALLSGIDSPREKVEKSNRLHRLWLKKLAEDDAQPLPQQVAAPMMPPEGAPEVPHVGMD
jgi:hypothetical protein